MVGTVQDATVMSTVALAALVSARSDRSAADAEPEPRSGGAVYVDRDGQLTLTTLDGSELIFGLAGEGAQLVSSWPVAIPVPAGRIVSSASGAEGWAVMVEVVDLAAADAGLRAVVSAGFAAADLWGTGEPVGALRDDNGVVWLENDRFLVAYAADPDADVVVVQIQVSYRAR